MYQQKSRRAAKVRKIKAMTITIIFHLALFGGLAFGTNLGETVKDTVKEWFQEETPKEKVRASLAKSKK
ncbi:MAG: hypothetical protein AAF573_22765 [Bacteroidota bacterium]